MNHRHVIKRHGKFVWGWAIEKDESGHEAWRLVETAFEENAMMFNCDQDARAFMRLDHRIVRFYQPALAHKLGSVA
jgi:hypothetical protein